MKKIRVLIADGHPAFREGLSCFLDAEEDMEVIAKSGDVEEVVRLAKKLLPDVVTIGIIMPNFNGIEAIKKIKEVCPTTTILMISGYRYKSYLLDSLRAGASGYLLNYADAQELTGAVRAVHAGEIVLDDNIARKALYNLTSGEDGMRGKPTELSPREKQILKLVAKGISNKNIAKNIYISERTVQTHMVNIFKKLEVGSRTEAVLHALREGWLT
ncbi:LuxR C-terminal-related transcriptional regulator, partial [Chloroflexota bacterium]